ncbi:MAG: UDP-N-acetylmuramoyl-L-alanine--D-glutamate ligase [Gemmatimonadota bacterium]|nr:UDP-N-acetylmuramoyl-L-alanine--D-glutamate ligase [Gemmatimonadota bacterium]
MMPLDGRRVLVMGLGLFGGGVGAVRFLCKEGARVTVTDLRPAEALRESLKALDTLPVVYRLGGHEAADFRAADLIVANPGVPRSSPFLKDAGKRGIPVTTEICLFAERCKAPVVGITGSSGKTTTTSLAGEMIRRRYPRTMVGGNIGGSLLNELDEITADTRVVLELSSFQLDRLTEMKWSPQTAVVTNFAPNHLDIHGSLEVYKRAKRQIVAHQDVRDVAVLNGDDPEVRRWSGDGRRIVFSAQPASRADVYLVDGEIRHRIGGFEKTVCPAGEVALPGKHNLSNALAASGAALSNGVAESDIAAVLRTFKGLSHRLERVAEIRGVTYYNDSIATSPDRTQVALSALPPGLVLIAGGYDKGLAFSTLGRQIGRRVSHLVLMGQTSDAIAASVPAGSTTRILRADSLDDAVSAAAKRAAPGSTVLFSPASASYDRFRNFTERGDRFRQLVLDMRTDDG